MVKKVIFLIKNSIPVPFLIWANCEPGEELNSEKDDDKVVDEVDDEDDAGEVNLPLLVLLQLLRRRDDEGDGGDHHLISKWKRPTTFGKDHHEKREEGKDLSEFACPWIFNCAPQPGPPLKMRYKVRKIKSPENNGFILRRFSSVLSRRIQFPAFDQQQTTCFC